MNTKEKEATYSIILPTYNERENLPIIIYLIMKYMNAANLSFEVVIVDDNSPDGTAQVARDLQAIYGPKKIIVTGREAKLGLGKLASLKYLGHTKNSRFFLNIKLVK